MQEAPSESPPADHVIPEKRHVAALPSLTGVRGIAALWVLLFHLQSFSAGLGIGWLKGMPVLSDGWAGVDLFFVLSGFILMHVHAEDFRHPRLPVLGRFARLRFFRIYPLATVVLLLIALIVFLDPGFAAWYRDTHQPEDLTLIPFLRTLTLSTRWFEPFTGDWNQPVWSLSAELVGYCALPLLAFLAIRLNGPIVLALLALFELAAPQILAPIVGSRLDNDIFGFALVRMAGAFTGGVLLCRLHHETPETLRRGQGALGDLALVLTIASLFTPLGTTPATVGFGILIYGLASGRGVANWLFAHPVSMFMGRISFPLYLLHLMPMLWLYYELGHYGVDPLLRAAASSAYLVAVIIGAWGLHQFVEKPSQRLGRA